MKTTFDHPSIIHWIIIVGWLIWPIKLLIHSQLDLGVCANSSYSPINNIIQFIFTIFNIYVVVLYCCACLKNPLNILFIGGVMCLFLVPTLDFHMWPYIIFVLPFIFFFFDTPFFLLENCSTQTFWGVCIMWWN